MLLPVAELSNKENKEIKAILRISFEYLIACISEAYAIGNKPTPIDIKDFNKKNTLSFSKLISFPFFVSLSNGHSKSLYNLFGNFYSLEYAPASIALFNNWKEFKADYKYFNLAPTNQVTIEILNLDNYTSFSVLKESILDEKIMWNNTEIIFKEIEILSDNQNRKSIVAAIDSGINAINLQSGNGFFHSNIKDIALQASYFTAYKERVKKDVVEEMPYEEVEDNEKPFFVAE